MIELLGLVFIMLVAFAGGYLCGAARVNNAWIAGTAKIRANHARWDKAKREQEEQE